jgi:hypothetical protein
MAIGSKLTGIFNLHFSITRSKQMTEEFKAEEKIDVEETAEATDEQSNWTEEFMVAGEELIATVKRLVHETAVRRLVIKNEARNLHLEIPLVVGLAGMALWPVYAALGVIAALSTDCTIMVVRAGAKEAETAAS